MSILGIEFGSTRIKAVEIDSKGAVISIGSFTWENKFENGVWTYGLDEVQTGLREAVKDIDFSNVTAIGISAMMHGLLAFDKNGNLVTPFRTWRNTNTTEAAAKLSDLFDFHIPERWSVSQLYQDILDKRSYVKDIVFMTTLSGYVHYILTGQKVLGIGDASGMFPIADGQYHKAYMDLFFKETGINWLDLAPVPLKAGESAGALTKAGCEYLGIDAKFENIPLCPPEGDMQTGMVCTHSVAPRTGNISAGTSINACIVLDKPLMSRHNEIDVITTPTGEDVALIHCNTCTAELDQWIKIFDETLKLFGKEVDKATLYSTLYEAALKGDSKGITVFNTIAGEPILGTAYGAPMLMRSPDAKMSIAGIVKAQLFSSIATVKVGLDKLKAEEGVTAEVITCHGGLYKAKEGAIVTASALQVDASVMLTAGEGGAYGIALLALFMECKKSLPQFLSEIFGAQTSLTYKPDPVVADSFQRYYEDFLHLFPIQKLASEMMTAIGISNLEENLTLGANAGK